MTDLPELRHIESAWRGFYDLLRNAQDQAHRTGEPIPLTTLQRLATSLDQLITASKALLTMSRQKRSLAQEHGDEDLLRAAEAAIATVEIALREASIAQDEFLQRLEERVPQEETAELIGNLMKRVADKSRRRE